MDPAYVFDSGNLALDLVNTRSVSGGEPVDRLVTALDADAWLAEAGVVLPGAVRTLSARLQTRILADLQALRDAMLECVEAARDGRSLPDEATSVINAILSTRPTTLRLEVGPEGPIRRTVGTDREISALLVPVAEAALSLLVDADPRRLGQCADEECVLWFLDTTKNRSRRWCSMARCGNRHKVAAHYRRAKAPSG